MSDKPASESNGNVERRDREYVVETRSGELVKSGALAIVSVAVEHVFRPKRFIVDDECAPCFQIVMMEFGGKAQMPFHVDDEIGRVTGCPAVVFTKNALYSELLFDTVRAGGYLIFVVRNESESPQPFRVRVQGWELVEVKAEEEKVG